MSRFSYKTLFIILIFLLIPVVFLLKINQKSTKTLAAWWNDSWMYRQAINISSHSSAESNVYITTTINIGDTTKTQSDAGDFRFTDAGGNLLSYYLVSGTGTTAITFHIQLDSFPSGAQTIYAYYGNPSASNGFSASDFSTAATNYTIGSLGTEETGGAPVAWWKFDEGVGTTAYDSSSNKNNGVFAAGSSAPTWTDTSQCISGKCLYFDGTNDQVAIPSISKINTPYTVSFWIKPQKSNAEQTIISLKGSNSFPKFELNANNKFLAYSGPEKYRYGSKIFTTNDLNQWYQVTFIVADSSSLSNWKIYINGQDSSGTTGSNTGTYFEPGSSGYLGSGGGSFHYQGYLDEVKIYPYVRTPAQIAQDYTTSGTNTSFGSSSTKSLSDGLVGYWKFDEGTGTSVVDYSGYNQNLSIIWQSAVNPSPWAPGKWSFAFQDAGYEYSNDEKAGTNWKAPTQTDFSISLWFNPSSTAPLTTSNGYIASRWWGDCSDSYTPGWAINYSFSTKKINFKIAADNCGPDGNLSTGTSFSPNTWYNLVAVHKNGESIKMYVNGVLDSQTSYALGLNSSAPNLSFGCGANNNNCGYPGLTDEVRIYNRALSTDDIKQLYNYSPSPTLKSPIAWYKFDEGQGSTTNNSGTASTITNTLNNISWSNDAKYNKSVSFNGTNSSVSLSPITQLNSTGFTVSGWMKIFSQPGYYSSMLASSNSGFVVYFDQNTRRPWSQIRDSSTWTTISCPSQSIGLNEWGYIALAYDSTSKIAKVYFNGKQCSSNTTIVNGINSSYATNINLGLYSSYYHNGLIDDVKIYNYALSADEIKADYNQSSSAVFGVTNLTVGNTSTSATYCVPGSTDPCSPPVAEWKFDEGLGTTAYDTSGNNNKLAINNATFTPGKIGKSLSFNGTNSYTNYTDPGTSSLDITGTGTFEAWVKWNTFKDYGVILQKGNGGSPTSFNYGIWSYSNRIQCYIGDGSTINQTSVLSSNIPVGVWHHIACVADGTNFIPYVDGVRYPSTSQTIALTANNNPFSISHQNYSLDGSIDQVRIYNYARTPAQIAWDYNQGAPIGWWKFDECQGSVVNDSSGIGNTGSITIGTNGSQNTLGTCQVGTSAAWTNGTTGKFNSSLNFDGSDDKITINNNSLFQLSNGTISAWIKTTNAGSNYRGIIAKQNAYGMFLRNNEFGVYDWTTNSWRGSGFSPNDGNWHHLLCTFQSGINNGTLCYVDGQLILTTTITVYNQPITLQIAEANASQYFSGQIDDVRIYNYTLTSEQIKQIYNGGAINFN